jgi:hypothetical protein
MILTSLWIPVTTHVSGEPARNFCELTYTSRLSPNCIDNIYSEDRGRAKEFVELHDQVQVCFSWFILVEVTRNIPVNPQTSVNLLDSLESFLSTFQKDLSAVSGQISDLQDRSKDIDNRLRSRRVRSHHFLMNSLL